MFWASLVAGGNRLWASKQTNNVPEILEGLAHAFRKEQETIDKSSYVYIGFYSDNPNFKETRYITLKSPREKI